MYYVIRLLSEFLIISHIFDIFYALIFFNIEKYTENGRGKKGIKRCKKNINENIDSLVRKKQARNIKKIKF